jgi:hypothetical protein
MSHYGYVIADTGTEAERLVRSYILSTPGDRRIMEGWSISIKGGEHDALALFEKHKPYEPNARLWRVALALMPVDVPRETSEGEV